MNEKVIINDWFNTLLDHTPEAIMAFKAMRDKNGAIVEMEFLFSNKKALAIVNRSSLTGTFLSKEFPGTMKPGGLFETYVNVIETGEPWSGELIYDTEGFDMWVYVSVSKVEDGCIVSFIDISRRKLAEEKIKQQAHFIEQVMAMAPDIITVLELPSLNLVYSNEQNMAFHGFDRDEMVKMTLQERRDLIHPADSPRLEQFFATFQGKINDDEIVSCEYRARNKCGEWLWFLSRSKVFERHSNGGVRSIVNLIQNITTRKLSELQTIASKDLLEGITGVLPGMISVQSYPSHDFIPYSRHSFSVLGYDPDEVEKMTVEEKNKLVHPADREVLTNYWESFKTLPANEITSVEFRANVKSRGWIWLRARGKVFEREENGDVKNILNLIQDITDLKYAEMKVQQLNKALVINNKALESANSEIKIFNNIAANDYSETLRHLYTNLEHIVSQDARRLSDSGRANVRRAQSAIQKLRLLSDDLVAYTKLQEPIEKRQEMDIGSVVQAVLVEFSSQSHLFQFDMHCEQVFVFAYPSLLSLLFHHLLDNAIKFRIEDTGHKVVVDCRKSVPGSTIDGAQDNLQYQVITFTDNGIGFPPEELAKIFEIFTRLHEKSKYKGSGIGLAICKKVMDQHGGFIVAESQPGQGASFHCYFPV